MGKTDLTLYDLGYTDKWLKYGLLDEAALRKQLEEFERGDDQNSEHYRYGTLINWLRAKENISEEEVNYFTELAREDKDKLMAGSAVKELYNRFSVSDPLYELAKDQFSQFGNWTIKHIKGKELAHALKTSELSAELKEEAINYYHEWSSSLYIEMIIDHAQTSSFIEEFTTANFGKKIRNRASQRIKRLARKA